MGETLYGALTLNMKYLESFSEVNIFRHSVIAIQYLARWYLHEYLSVIGG